MAAYTTNGKLEASKAPIIVLRISPECWCYVIAQLSAPTPLVIVTHVGLIHKHLYHSR